jgi:hypothetical protein
VINAWVNHAREVHLDAHTSRQGAGQRMPGHSLGGEVLALPETDGFRREVTGAVRLPTPAPTRSSAASIAAHGLDGRTLGR